MRRTSIVAALVSLAALIFFAMGWKAVGPGEVIVVRRLGRASSAAWGPGSHWSWPLGIDRTTRLRLDEVRRLEFGGVGTPEPTDAPGSGEFLTGDLDIVRVRGEVQYRVADPLAYVLRSLDREGLLARLTEASLARALASRGIEAPLRDGRPDLAREIRASLARSADGLGLGVEILAVNLTDARPPVEVEPAFAEAQSAQSERDRRINEAMSIDGMIRPAAIADARASTDRAQAWADRELMMARGHAEAFLELLGELDRSRALTIRRIYRDSLRDLLPKVRRKVLMTPEESVDLGLFGLGSK